MSDGARRSGGGRVWRAVLAGVLSLAGAAGGCVTFYQAEPGGGTRVRSAGGDATDTPGLMRPAGVGAGWQSREAWPARWRVFSGLRRSTITAAGKSPMGVITRIEGPLGSARRGPEAEKRIEEELAEDVSLLAARHRSAGGSETITIRGEGKGSYLFARSRDAGAERIWDGPAGRPSMYLKFASAREAPEYVQRGPEVQGRLLLIDRTWMAFYEPAEAWGGPARGVVLLMPGMFGTPKEVLDLTVGVLRRHGWCVLRMLSQPSRFTERQEFAVDASNVEEMSRRVARELVDRAAECAYAAEAAMMYLDQQRPDLTGLPRAAVGMSGGAMVLPQVVAREPARYSGAVLIAGGVDYLRILLDSNYSDWIDAVRLRLPGGAEGTRVRAALIDGYRRHAGLDSADCLPALAGKRVLVLHAASDRAVPADLGEEMWRGLGEPERWVFSGGHEILFLMLPAQLERLATWLDEHVGGGAGTPAPAAN